MLNALIRFSLAQRGLIVTLALVVLVLAGRKLTQLPVEVLPDLTKPTVTILTEAPGFAPEEVETLVSVPLENASERQAYKDLPVGAAVPPLSRSDHPDSATFTGSSGDLSAAP